MISTTSQLREQYEQEGYFIVHDLLPDEAFRTLDQMINRLLDGELKPEIPLNGELPEAFYTFWEPDLKDREDLPRRQRIRLMSWMAYHHPYFWKVVSHPAIVDQLAEVWGEGAQFFSDTVFMKPARHGIEAAMHQDTAFWPKLQPRALNFWMAIDPATVENGCLHIIPGSHLVDLPHHQDPVQKWYLRDEDVDTSRQIPIELPPNSALFMDSGVVHRSYPNKSDRSRRSMTAVYVSASVEHLEPWDLDYYFKPIDA